MGVFTFVFLVDELCGTTYYRFERHWEIWRRTQSTYDKFLLTNDPVSQIYYPCRNYIQSIPSPASTNVVFTPSWFIRRCLKRVFRACFRSGGQFCLSS